MLFGLSSLTAVHAETDAELMAKGMWHDPATGLIWDRCNLGQTWNDNTCIGEIKKYTLNEAINVAKATRLGGYSDWQLPTVLQLRTLIRCDKGFGARNRLVSMEPLSSEKIEVFNNCNDDSARPTIDTVVFPKPYLGSYWTISRPPAISMLEDVFSKIAIVDLYGKDDWTGLGMFGSTSDSENTKLPVRIVRTSQSLGADAYKSFFNKEKNFQKDLLAQRQSDKEKREAVERARQEQELKAQQEAEAREVKRRMAKGAQGLYLEAAQAVKNGDSSKASDLYQFIIDKFPKSPFAVKAADQLTNTSRSGSVSTRSTACSNHYVGEQIALSESKGIFGTDASSFTVKGVGEYKMTVYGGWNHLTYNIDCDATSIDDYTGF